MMTNELQDNMHKEELSGWGTGTQSGPQYCTHSKQTVYKMGIVIIV